MIYIHIHMYIHGTHVHVHRHMCKLGIQNTFNRNVKLSLQTIDDSTINSPKSPKTRLTGTINSTVTIFMISQEMLPSPCHHDYKLT